MTNIRFQDLRPGDIIVVHLFGGGVREGKVTGFGIDLDRECVDYRLIAGPARGKTYWCYADQVIGQEVSA